MLEREGLHVLADASSGREAVELARRLRPEIVIIDISIPDLNGIDATRTLVSELRGLKVVGLSMHVDQLYVSAMLKAGAMAYISKNDGLDELARALRAVAAGFTYLSRSVAFVGVDKVVEPTSSREPLKALSLKEREVLQLLAEGSASKEIADRLSISTTTVESHRRNIVAKLNLHSVAQLTKYAMREGITSTD
jgi:DNA-binding NarL/FixJ family response regulator